MINVIHMMEQVINPWLFVGIGLGTIVLGIISFFWKKEEETDL